MRQRAEPSWSDRPQSRSSGWRGLLLGTLLVAAATGAAYAGRRFFSEPDVVMVYLFAIIIVAFRTSRRLTLVVAGLSVAAYDFFFVPPFFTLSVEQARHILSFAMMFGVGITVSTLTARLRSQELAARTEEMRSSILSVVSHDLRTPLAAITGAATALRDEGTRLDAAQRGELVDTLCTEAERMDRLVGNVLDMVRLESGGCSPRREWVPVEELVGAALARFETRLGEREVTVSLPDGLPLVPVDPVLMQQVFVNLLDNALKYTAPSSAIAIAARRMDRGIEIEVADRGPGLPAGMERAVFGKFVRGPRMAGGGVGLGLAICQGIVRAHGGGIEACQADGGGACFRVRLPLGDGAPPLREPEEELA